MMSTFGGKPCNNCNTVLQPPKWEIWLKTVVIFGGVLMANSDYVRQDLSASTWKVMLGLLIFCLVSIYLISALIPWTAQPKSDL